MALVSRVLLIWFALACACSAPAVVAFDSNGCASAASSTSLSWNHTCTGLNLVLVVGICESGSTDYVTSVTYGGQALSKIGASFTANGKVVVQYKIVAPTTGTHTVSITTSAAVNIGAVSQSFTGANGNIDSQQTQASGVFTFNLNPGDAVCDIEGCSGASAFGDTYVNFVGVSGVGYVIGGSTLASGSSLTCGTGGSSPCAAAVRIHAGVQVKGSSGLACMGVG